MLYEYVDLTTAKAGIHAKSSATANDDEYVRLLRAASRYVDRKLRRGEGAFHAQIETRYFDGNGMGEWWIPMGDDLLSVTTMKVDKDGDGVFELILTEDTDFWLLPLNSRDHFYRVVLNTKNSPISVFPRGHKRIEIAGVWGWSDESRPVSQLAEPLDASETAVDVDANHGISRGHIIQVGAEQMYVDAVAVNTLTVVRGINGTTAAAHDDDSAVSLRVVPDDIVQSVIMYTGRVWRRSESGFAQVLTQASEVGVYQVFRSVDPDVAQFLAPYELSVVA